MSSHYYSPVGGIFVGSLCAIGVFLFSYCGYDRRDKIAGRMACAFAVGVAMFPVRPDENFTETQELIGRFHLFSAAALFLTLAYFCLRLFVLTDKKKMTTEKLRRNKVYRTCGWTILGCIAAIGVVEWLFENPYSPYLASRVKEFSPVFWLEAIAVVAFGMSWLTKGEAILADED
jgi:cytochrome bd-type quinol oxidase subunit 2